MSRYRAGKVPEYKETKPDEEIEDVAVSSRPILKQEKASAPVDRRLLRGGQADREEAISERRRNRSRHEVAEVLAEGVEDDDGEAESMDVSKDEGAATESQPTAMNDDADENDKRRERLRQKMLQKVDNSSAAQVNSSKMQEESEEEEEESEEEEEEEFPSRPHFAPVFKKKDQRDTVSEQKKLEDEEEALEKERQRRREELAQEAKELLEIEKKRNEEAPPEELTTQDMEDDEEEEESNAEEYEKWKVREYGRIKKEREEREKIEQEKEELERRRKLSDREIESEDADKLAPREKQKQNFLQRYYHKGAYFRTFDENDQIANKWNFNQPTLEDKQDKSILPSVMQVKKFGRSSQTKYTHLTDQDTSKFDSPWFDKKDPLLKKYKGKMAGTGSVNNKRK